QLRMGAPGEDLQFAEPARHDGVTNHLGAPCRPFAVTRRDRSSAVPPGLAGAEGFEPSNTGSKVPRLTAWPRPIPFTPLAPRRRPPVLLMSFSNSGDPERLER